MADTRRIKTLQGFASRAGDGQFAGGANRAQFVVDDVWHAGYRRLFVEE